jgi:hypothetical protein
MLHDLFATAVLVACMWFWIFLQSVSHSLSLRYIARCLLLRTSVLATIFFFSRIVPEYEDQSACEPPWLYCLSFYLWSSKARVIYVASLFERFSVDSEEISCGCLVTNV